MKAWEAIRSVRTDMSQYVLHCTKPVREESGKVITPAFDVLRSILHDGSLRATYAVFKSKFGGEAKPTVRGPCPAACFTEQPLGFFIQTVEADFGERYTGYAVALRKDDLFAYGGRPVIYSDEPALGTRVDTSNDPPWMYKDGLPVDQRHLWVGYDPTALWYRPYPVDWTHEREWRARPNGRLNGEAGVTDPYNSVPLALPSGRFPDEGTPRLVLFVAKEQEVIELKDWIGQRLASIAGRDSYGGRYAEVLHDAPVLSLDVIKACIAATPGSLGRVEDYFSS